MNQDPSIDDGMTANDYVRCGGCGGYLPAGAICGYCLQQQQHTPLSISPAPKRMGPQPTTGKWRGGQGGEVRPARTALTLALCALAVCGIGLASVAVIRGVGKVAHPVSPGSLSGPGFGGQGDVLSSQSNQRIVAALNSGNTQQAIAALQSVGPQSTPTLEARGSEPQTAPTMQAADSTPTPTLEAGNGMPDNVRRWLEHLQKIEQARVALAANQLTDGVRTLATLRAGDLNHAMDEDGTDQAAEKRQHDERAQKVGGDMGTMRQAWQTLLSAFDSVPAPAECVGIKANYDQVIGQTGTMILEIVAQIKSASNDPQGALAALTAMQGTSKSKIDVPARAADEGVGNVCKRYDVVKWFDIQGDVGSGVMSQVGF